MNIFIKHLHISQKSSIFAVAFGLLGVFNVIPFYTPYTAFLPLWLSW